MFKHSKFCKVARECTKHDWGRTDLSIFPNTSLNPCVGDVQHVQRHEHHKQPRTPMFAISACSVYASSLSYQASEYKPCHITPPGYLRLTYTSFCFRMRGAFPHFGSTRKFGSNRPIGLPQQCRIPPIGEYSPRAPCIRKHQRNSACFTTVVNNLVRNPGIVSTSMLGSSYSVANS